MGGPWLSVVLPTFNGERFLEHCLSSLVRELRGRDDLEIVAIDDGSTDGTRSLLTRFGDPLPLRVELRDHCGNWVSRTNEALSLARGEHACILHQDDAWLPGRLRTLRDAVAQGDDCALWLHPARYIDARGRGLGPWRCPLPVARRPMAPEVVLERLLIQNFIAIPAPLFRREAALDLGGLDETLWYTADWDFWLKLAAAGPTWYEPAPLCEFRIHDTSQTSRRSRDGADFAAQLHEVVDRHLGRLSGTSSQRSVERAARFSADVNVVLAAASHGERAALAPLARSGLRLGPGGWQRFLRDSRIFERSSARIRARLLARRARGNGAPGS